MNDLTDQLLRRVGLDYVDALTDSELAAHIAASTHISPPTSMARANDRRSNTMPTATESTNLEFLNRVRSRLGVTDAEATEETILAALDDRLAAQVRASAPGLVPEGTVLIDAEQWNRALAAAEEGRQARAEQVTARRDALIADAIREGRISSADAETYRQLLDADEPAGAKILAGFQPNTARGA